MIKRLMLLIMFTLLGYLFMSSTIDLDNLFNYSDQYTPVYISKDNSSISDPITNEIATLGRVLFYDKKLSVNNSVSCASCHIQEKGFGDNSVQSLGFSGELAARHTPRLINVRYGDETSFFWDERASSLEEQVTMPIKNHIEMGFSGTNGNPDIEDLCDLMHQETYYELLFQFAFGDSTITEERIQIALAQFIRSIQSFDSKFDIGLSQVSDINDDFPNFTDEENIGKRLYLADPENGGAGCNSCHVAPEFDIHPLSKNNGIISVAGSETEIDLTNTRSPSMRDLINPNGELNGPMMHDGSVTSLMEMIDHYNNIPDNPLNTNLDILLKDNDGNPQVLGLNNDEKNALISFLKTLTGNDIYVNEKWSNPFDENDNITINGSTLSTQNINFDKEVNIYPIPAKDYLNINIEFGNYELNIFDLSGRLIVTKNINNSGQININGFNSGIYLLEIKDLESNKFFSKKIIKR